MPSTSQRIYPFMDFDTTEWERNLDEFDKYVMNYIPIRLIRLSNMKFAERNDVRKHFRGSVSRQKCDRHPASHVKYAVLSHRWLDEGEPTYRDMKSGTAIGRGYQKLKNFCEKAREYGMEFAWSDTCCIDSTNSTEVDESIRSMYRWYFNSDICIIHLAQSETIDDILYDEWTKRGWTLQELLAPVNIKLFNRHWRPMTRADNDKNRRKTEVMTILSLATGIPHGDLWVFRPGQVRVDERMAWAARRETTRVEDVAYSLIGIFDVNLQTSYGEGGERAFCRLIEAIMQGGDPSVLNWTGEALLYKSSRAFPRSPKNFVGQTLRLPPIHERLEMTTTGRGLRLPLVILPLTSGDAPQAGWVTFQLWKTVKSEIYSKAADYLTHRSYQFALGIVNYTIGSYEMPRIWHRNLTGLILYRKPERPVGPGVPYIPTTSSGLEEVSPPKRAFGPWKKVDGTRLVEVDFPDLPDQSASYISSKYLEIVYL